MITVSATLQCDGCPTRLTDLPAGGAPHYVVSLSGGMASAVAADRAITRYGRGAVTLWFADTQWEDADLYRFLDDCLARWGGDLIRITDGRTPLQVASDEHVIPGPHLAPCSDRLKVRPFRRWLAKQPKPLTVLLGLDWREQHRMASPTTAYTNLGYGIDFPLMWEPLEFRPYSEVIQSWGIRIPHLYTLGFPHNNCGGRCVRQGQAEWYRLRRYFPERFAEVRDWEASMRALGPPWSERAILRDRRGRDVRSLPLSELEQQAQEIEELQPDDLFGCFCEVG